MEEGYEKALEVIFVYGYECCMFKHNICESQPEVLDGMPDSSNLLPPEFFANLGWPLVPAVTKAAAAEVDMIEHVKPEKIRNFQKWKNNNNNNNNNYYYYNNNNNKLP